MTTVGFAGRLFDVTGHDETAIALVLERLQPVDDAAVERAPSGRVHVHFDATDGPAWVWTTARTAGPSGTGRVVVTEDEVWVLEPGAPGQPGQSVHARFDEGGGTVTAHGTPFVAWAALWSALHEAVGATGLVPLHAAAIARKERCALLLAPSGRGKSTTMLAAVRDGWQPLAEDICWVDPESGCAHAVDRGVKLLDDSLDRARRWFPGLEPGIALNGKHWVPFEQLGTARVDSARVTDLVVIERDPAHPTGWRGESPATAVMALWQAAGIPTGRRRRERLGRDLGRLATSARAQTLHLGPEPVVFDVLSER